MYGKNEISLKLKELFITDVAADVTQKRPKFEMTLTPENVNGLLKGVDIFGAGNIQNSELAKNLSGLLEYSHELAEPMSIPGGWDTPRCAFNMLVEYTTPIGMVVWFVIAGFTNRRPVNTLLEGKELDWEGVDFYVNYVTAVRSMKSVTPEGPKTTYSVADAQLLLAERTDNYLAGRFNRIRPGDVFSSLGSLALLMGDLAVSDTRTMVTSQGAFSKREHVIPAVWFGEILRSYAQASQFGLMNGDLDAYAQARGQIVEQVVYQNPFLRAIGQHTGLNQTHFTVPTMRNMFPDFDSVTVYVTNSKATKPVYVEGDSMWHSAALLVGHGTTGLMGALGLTSIDFHATNLATGPQPEVLVSQAVPLLNAVDADLAPVIMLFKKRFIEEIVPEISYNGLQSFKLSVTAHIGGITQVSISSGEPGEDPHVRTIASYADSLLSPLVYSPEQEKERMSLVNDISHLLLTLEQPPTPGNFGTL